MDEQKRGSLGGKRLRVLREYYRRTQLDVELEASLGIGYLQRVESGKVQQPERDTLERILKALNARYTERRGVLESFGYIVDAPIPNEAEICWAVERCQTELERALFPAYLLDCAHRLLAWNRFIGTLFRPQKAYISMLRLIFDPSQGVSGMISNPQVFFPAQIRALQYEMQWFHDAAWYALLIDEMRGHPLFEQYWSAAKDDQPHLPARPLNPLELDVGTERLQFRLIAEPFAEDHRFRVIYYLPGDAATIKWCVG